MSISRLRRELLVEGREDRRVLGVAAELGLAGEVEEHRADGPAEREPGDGAEQPAADVVEEPQRAEHEQCPPEAAARHRPDRLADRRAQHRDAEGDERKPPAEVAADERGADPRADVEAEREPGEREDADDEASPEAGERGQDDERERDQIDGRHSSRFGGIAAPLRDSGAP